MRLYFEVARRSFQRHLTYRVATLAGLFTNAVFGIFFSSVYRAFYQDGERGVVADFTLPEILTFVWIGQSLLMLVYLWNWWEVADSIRTGDVVSDLMKPMDFQLYWLSRDLGRASCHWLTRFVPTFAMGALLFDLAWPGTISTWLAFFISVNLAILVSFGWRFLLNLSAFWLLDVRGINTIAVLVLNFFSGLLVPIAFFPGWLRTVAEWLPFRAIVMVPVEVFLGQRTPQSALLIQAFWVVALRLLGQGVLNAGGRKLVVQGG
ncbi:MAG: ABC-2 family transporter protein [Chloroflexota bacterium]|nr:ABC-2 family transporter protein [Chloroflexota bacterium]